MFEQLKTFENYMKKANIFYKLIYYTVENAIYTTP